MRTKRIRTLQTEQILLPEPKFFGDKVRRIVLRRGSVDHMPLISMALWTHTRGAIAARLNASELAELIIKLFELILQSRLLREQTADTLKKRLNIDIEEIRKCRGHRR